MLNLTSNKPRKKVHRLADCRLVIYCNLQFCHDTLQVDGDM